MPVRRKSTSISRRTVSPEFIKWLEDRQPCPKAMRWIKKQSSLKDAWKNCPDHTWMQWFICESLYETYQHTIDDPLSVAAMDNGDANLFAYSQGVKEALGKVYWPRASRRRINIALCILLARRYPLKEILRPFQQAYPTVPEFRARGSKKKV